MTTPVDDTPSARDWLTAVMASTLDPVLSINDQGIIQLASRSVEAVFGWRPEELVGRNISLLMPEPYRSEHDGHLAHYRRTGKTGILGRPREFHAIRKDGSVFPCEISVSLSELGETGRPVFTGIVRDISQRRLAEQERLELTRRLEQKNRELEAFAANAGKLASLGKLAASIAHEIRNPLTSIKVRLFSMRRSVGGDLKLTEKFDLVSEELDRLEGVVRHFLEFSKPPTPRMQACSAADLVEKTLPLVEHDLERKKIRLTRRLPRDLPPASADAELIRQVLLNLLTNAIEATKEGGRIEVQGEAVASEGSPMIAIHVCDEGPGVSAEMAERIFQPFATGKPEGTGLGLYISAAIAERHGGRLTLESTGPAGSRFTLKLPQAKVEEPA